MAQAASNLTSTISFTDPEGEDFALGVHSTLQHEGLAISTPKHQQPPDALMGTPEVILTLFLATAGRAVLLAALGALEKYLETRIAAEDKHRIQIVLIGHEELPQRFALSLRGISVHALHIFIARLRSAIEKF